MSNKNADPRSRLPRPLPCGTAPGGVALPVIELRRNLRRIGIKGKASAGRLLTGDFEIQVGDRPLPLPNVGKDDAAALIQHRFRLLDMAEAAVCQSDVYFYPADGTNLFGEFIRMMEETRHA